MPFAESAPSHVRSNYIIPGLGLNLSQWGDIMGVPVFAFHFVASLLFSGEVADSFNRPRLLGAILLILSGLTAVRAGP
jgi:hypothetical protein